MALPDDPVFEDVVRIAVDDEDAVGAFSTGGVGPIPATALRGAVDGDGLEGRLEALAVLGRPAAIDPAIAHVATDVGLAERGFHVYDWPSSMGLHPGSTAAYVRVGRPSVPLTAASLPADLAAIARVTRLAVRFRRMVRIDLIGGSVGPPHPRQ